MDLKKVKSLRTLIPGILIFFSLYKLLNETIQISKIIGDYSVFISLGGITLLAYVIGAIYYFLDLRKLVLRYFTNEINKNIMKNLLLVCKEFSLSFESFLYLQQWDILNHVFFKIIDSDESLRNMKINVYWNSVAWSTTGDIATISFISSLTYLVAFLFVENSTFPILGLVFLLVFLFALFVLIPITTKRHIKYGNQQIKFIEIHYKKELEEKLLALINKGG